MSTTYIVEVHSTQIPNRPTCRSWYVRDLVTGRIVRILHNEDDAFLLRDSLEDSREEVSS